MKYLRLQRALDRDVLAALRTSYASVSGELLRLQGRTGIGAAVRHEQLVFSQAAINRQMAAYWQRVGDLVQSQQAEAAAVAAESMVDRSLLRNVFPAGDADYLIDSMKESARHSVDVAMERVSGSSYIPLSESVYTNAALTSGKVDDIVTAALARGASAVELAKDVRDFIRPDTPGGVRYASMRLGRTELNNAFHASQVRQAQQSPWTTGVLWNLSGSHPVPDECNEYADNEHFTGGGAGVFRPEEVPAKPHPNCLCYTTPEDVDRDEFIRQFEAGQYDPYLDENFPDLPRDPGRLVSPNAPLSGTQAHSGLSSDYSRWMGANATPEQQEAFIRYTTTSAYQKWNPYLRGQAADVTEKDLEQIRIVRKMIEESPPLESPVAAYRGLKDPDAVFGSTMEKGTVIQDDAFISTTMDNEILDYYKGEGGASISVRVPEGTRVAVAETEGQLVLAPGTRFKVVSDKDVEEILNQGDYDYLAGQGYSPEEFREKLVQYRVIRTYREIVLEVI